jgi:hypothetical protein
VPSLKKMLKIGFTREEKRTTICNAIRQLRAIEFYYHGGYRTVEPFALGIVLPGDADNESLICWQTGGFSELREVVGWKLYRESEMEDIVVRNDEFNGERPNYDPDNIGLWQVICCVRTGRRAEPAPAPTPLPVIESAPEPPPEPAPLYVRYLTHNELMARFRFAHPRPIPELDTRLWPNPLAVPYSHPLESAAPAPHPDRYLVGRTA